MTAYAAAADQGVARRHIISLEISVPWRLLAIAIALFGTADIVALEISEPAATGMFFSAYGSVAAASTMFITRRGSRRV